MENTIKENIDNFDGKFCELANILNSKNPIMPLRKNFISDFKRLSNELKEDECLVLRNCGHHTVASVKSHEVSKIKISEALNFIDKNYEYWHLSVRFCFKEIPNNLIGKISIFEISQMKDFLFGIEIKKSRFVWGAIKQNYGLHQYFYGICKYLNLNENEDKYWSRNVKDFI